MCDNLDGLGGMRLSETSQTQEEKYCVISRSSGS